MSALFGSVAAKLARCMPRMMLDVALKIIIRRRVSPRPPSRILSLKQVVVFGDGAPSGMYRIPSLLRLPDGTLFALCEERLERADSGSVRVVARSSSDGGSTWSALRIVASGAEIGLEMAGATVGNPCCVYDAVRDRIVLLVTVNDGSAHESAICASRREEITRDHARSREIRRTSRPSGEGTLGGGVCLSSSARTAGSSGLPPRRSRLPSARTTGRGAVQCTPLRPPAVWCGTSPGLVRRHRPSRLCFPSLPPQVRDGPRPSRADGGRTPRLPVQPRACLHNPGGGLLGSRRCKIRHWTLSHRCAPSEASSAAASSCAATRS
jgi:hypothetical protein